MAAPRHDLLQGWQRVPARDWPGARWASHSLASCFRWAKSEHIDERYADHRNPLAWSLLTGIRPTRQERMGNMSQEYSIQQLKQRGRFSRRNRPARSMRCVPHATQHETTWRESPLATMAHRANAPPSPIHPTKSCHSMESSSL